MSTFREMGDMIKGEGFYSEKKTGSDIMKPMSYLTSLDLVETNNEYKVISDIPGVDPSCLNVWLDGRSLCFKAKRDDMYSEVGTKLHKQNIAYGEVERHVRLPKNAGLEQAKIEYKNGVLMACFPKLAVEVEPEHKMLTVNTA
jgi:HSP20 family molecular chaperone IbpA